MFSLSPQTINQAHKHNMRLVICTEAGDAFHLDVSSDIEIENLQALLEAEVRQLSRTLLDQTGLQSTQPGWILENRMNRETEC